MSDRLINDSDRSKNDENLPHSHAYSNSSNQLIEAHFKDLQSSGLTDEAIAKTGHFSVNEQRAKNLVGFNLPGLIFNYRDPDGNPYLCKNGASFYRIKPDWGDRKTEDSPKYLSPQGNGCRPYFSRLYADWKKAIQSSKIDLWETEGEKKGDCACLHGLAAIAFSGVDGWQDHCSRNQDEDIDKSRVLPELQAINWTNRKVYQCFDSDIVEKVPVQLALARRAYELNQSGALPYLVLLPNELDGSKNGLDDFVTKHGIEALRELAKTAQQTSYRVSELSKKEGEGSQEKTITLKLEEPNEHYKAILAWSILKEVWAYRPGVGWYEWQTTHWSLRTVEEFEATLIRFMDAQNWRKRNSTVITSVVRLLRSRLLIRDHLWNPFGRIACTNGTLNIFSEEFTPSHNPYDRITRLRPYAFDLSADCPTWLQFIHEAMEGDQERVKLIQALFRYAVLPRPKDRKAEIEKSFDLFGQKGTGKGTTLDVLINLVGPGNVGSVSVDTFKSAVGLGQLIDKDLAIDSDASGFLSNVGAYNKVVSNEPVEVKKLYQNCYTTRLGVLVVRAYNAFIDVPNSSEGLDRRITVIPFNHQPKTVDIQLSKKLMRELSGIFAWCYSLSSEEMKQSLLYAGKIRKVSEASIARFEANNPEYRFLSESFPDGKDSIQAGKLFGIYEEWCKKNGHQPKSQVKFRPAIENLNCKRSHGKINGNYYYFIPAMKDFDVAAHLGMVEGGLEDSWRDSSNPSVELHRDSCRQLEPKSSNNSQIKDERFDACGKKEDGLQPSTTIPNPTIPGVTTVSKLSQSVSTVSFRVGDRVEVLYEGMWEPASLISIPIHDHDQTKTTSFWSAKLDIGIQRYIWKPEQIRELANTSCSQCYVSRTQFIGGKNGSQS